MKRFKSLIGKDKSRRAAPINPGYDVSPSDISTFRGPTELPKVEHEISGRRSYGHRRSNALSSDLSTSGVQLNCRKSSIKIGKRTLHGVPHRMEDKSGTINPRRQTTA